MRDIKFRAFDKETKTMVYPEDTRYVLSLINGEWSLSDYAQLEYETDEYGLYDIELPHETSDIEVMQYTGMKDVNGVEIYEGDILQSEHYFKYKVVFKGDCWRCESLKNSRFKNRFIGRDLKVIGNIYENPELLED